MKKNIKKIFVFLLLLFLVGAGFGIYNLYQKSKIATAYSAKLLCSSVFVSNRNPENVINEELEQFGFINKNVNIEEKYVTTDIFGLSKRKAIFREGLGCTLTVGTTEEELRNQIKNGTIKLQNANNKIDFSNQNSFSTFTNQSLKNKETNPNNKTEQLEKLAFPINENKINQIIDEAFSEPDKNLKRRTRALVIIHKGKVLAERYAQGFNENTPILGWSMTKSIMNALIGILIKDDLISLEQNNLFDEWKNDDRKEITLNNLLQMSSGLEFSEEYDQISDATKMLFSSFDMGKYALNKPLEVKPGTKWYYSSGTSNIISKLIRNTTEKNALNYHTFPYEKLFNKLGMKHVTMETDGSGNFVGSSYMYASARDWAQFGLLYLNDGVWEGERILPEGWVKYTTTPASHAHENRYGSQFWLNKTFDQDKKHWQSLPENMFYPSGFEGQSVAIFPSKELVIVRLGLSRPRDAWNFEDFHKKVLDLLEK